MAYQSDTDTVSTTTASKQKKLQSQHQDLSDRVAKNWPFTRMDPRLIEQAHKEFKAKELANAEPAPY